MSSNFLCTLLYAFHFWCSKRILHIFMISEMHWSKLNNVIWYFIHLNWSNMCTIWVTPFIVWQFRLKTPPCSVCKFLWNINILISLTYTWRKQKQYRCSFPTWQASRICYNWVVLPLIILLLDIIILSFYLIVLF